MISGAPRGRIQRHEFRRSGASHFCNVRKMRFAITPCAARKFLPDVVYCESLQPPTVAPPRPPSADLVPPTTRESKGYSRLRDQSGPPPAARTGSLETIFR